MTGIFSWLRESVRNAVLNGVQDAMNDLEGVQIAVVPVTLALPAGGGEPEGEPAKGPARKERAR